MENTICSSCQKIDKLCSCAKTNKLIIQRGTKINDYIIDKKLGSGGMGEVWLCHHHQQHNILMAIKILKPELVNYSNQVTRFTTEVEILSKIRHPNLVSIYNFNYSNKDLPYFIIMEFLQGMNLSEYITNKKELNFELIVNIVEQICRGLKAIHNGGIIHRDLKPDNIFVVSDQNTITIKIIDLGIAKNTNDNKSPTAKGDILGTLAYMSPEQLEGKSDIDFRADIFSLGMIIYEMIAGVNPFKIHGASHIEIINNRIKLDHQPPKLHNIKNKLGLDISDNIDFFIKTYLLNVNPENRIKDCEYIPSELLKIYNDIGVNSVKQGITKYEVGIEDDILKKIHKNIVYPIKHE